MNLETQSRFGFEIMTHAIEKYMGQQVKARNPAHTEQRIIQIVQAQIKQIRVAGIRGGK